MKLGKACFCVVLLAVFNAPTAAFGDDSWDKVSPLINQDTVLAARIDVDSIDIAAAVDKIAQLAKFDRNEKSELDSRAKSLLQLKQRYSQLGGREIFLLASVADILDQSPALAFEVASGHDASELSAFIQGEPNRLRQRGEIICQPIAGFVLCGRQKTVDRYRQLVAAGRPEFKETAKKLAESSVQIVATVPESQRRVFQEVPRLPDSLSHVRGDVVVRGLNTIGIGLSATPRASLQTLISCANQESAAEVGKLIAGGMRMLADLPDVKQQLGDISDMLKLVVPEQQGNQLLLHLREDRGMEEFVAGLAIPLQRARQAARRALSFNHLKHIALAMLNFESAWGSFPPSASYDDEGKQLLSWRVFILPFIEEEELYKQFHLDEPWDSPHNKTLISKMPETFSSPMSDLPKGRTRYLAPLGTETMFSGKEGTPFKQIADGSSRTILVVEASPSKAVVWTKPEDVEIDENKPRTSFLEDVSSSFNAAYCDGSVRAVSPETGSKSLWALFTKGAGDVVE